VGWGYAPDPAGEKRKNKINRLQKKKEKCESLLLFTKPNAFRFREA
jgi:hypothetical protein